MAKWIFFLRAFFPSWKFFVDAGPSLILEARIQDQTWINCLPQIERSLGTVFFNPEGNLLHACHNNLIHLAADLSQSGQDVATLVSYRLTHNMVRFYLERVGLLLHGSAYQFRVRLLSETLLESPIYVY